LAKKRGCEAKCPNPIRISFRAPSEGLEISDTHVSETDYSKPLALTQEAMMTVDVGGPAAEGNSPTPKADIPLIPTAAATPQISDMMKLMKDCMDEQFKQLGMQLKPLIKHIERLEEPKFDYDNMVPDYTHDEYKTWAALHDDLEYIKVDPVHTVPPPRIDNNELMHDMDEAHTVNVAAFDANAEEDDEQHVLFNMGLAPTDEEIQYEAAAERWTTEKVQEVELAQLAR
jgi:hypothetical protein